MAWNVVIAGGGFGGYSVARTLERELPTQSTRITLVNDVNYLLYTPLLPGAAAGTLEPRHVVVPLREELRRTDLRIGTVTGADPRAGVLRATLVNGTEQEIPYDHLVVALGSVSRTLPIPGLREHAIGFKTLSEAISLRNRVVAMLETAETIDDPQARASYLTFAFVGAGYAGLEGLAELQHFMSDVIELYPRCRVQGMRWILIEARDRVMPEIPPSLAEFATRELRGRGIEIRTSTTLEGVAPDRVCLSGGESIPCRTVVWTAGVKPHPAVARLGLPLDDGGRVVTDRAMRVEGHRNVWAVGDAAAIPDPARTGRVCPPTAQHAIRQGRRAARNIAAALGSPDARVRPFRYRTLGVFVDMGRYRAVALTMGIRWRGFPAWFLARTYHLLLMPGAGRELRLVTDWTVDLLFPRDTSELGHVEPHAPGLESHALEGQSAGGTDGRALSAEPSRSPAGGG